MNKFPQSLQYIIQYLKSEKIIDNSLLIKILDNAGLDKSDYHKYNKFGHDLKESYGRTQLYDGGSFNVYLMTWNPGDFTAIHSHGHSDWGAVYFFGKAEHRLYTIENNNIKLSAKEIIESNQVKEVCGNLIHAMGNAASEPFLTLHIYGSNNYRGIITEDSKVFDLENNKVYVTKGPAFLNIEDKYCKSILPGVLTDSITIEDYREMITPFYKRNRLDSILDKIII